MARKAAKWIGLVLVGAVAVACVRRWRRRQGTGDEPAARLDGAGDRPPLAAVPDPVPEPDPEPAPAPVPTAAPVPAAPEPAVAPPPAGPRWLPPIGDDCPPGHPVKVNERSGIYHVPGGLSYDRTRPTRCYPDEAAAEADGFRRAKR